MKIETYPGKKKSQVIKTQHASARTITRQSQEASLTLGLLAFSLWMLFYLILSAHLSIRQW